MSRRQIIVPIAVFALLSLAVGSVLCFAKIHPLKDCITDLNYPMEFFCAGGERIAPEMGRIFGFVSADSIVRVFEKHGFSAKPIMET